jgi:radical SAM protein with 4Fe4S-binding SPASM domain
LNSSLVSSQSVADFGLWERINRPRIYSCFFDLRVRRDSEEKNALIRSVRATPEEGLAVLTRDRDRYYEEMRQFCTKFMKPSGDLLFSCGCGKGGCVDAYGSFQPCMMLRVPALVCDLREVSLKGALENRFPKLREMKAENPDYLVRCALCFLKGLCEQCPAKSWMENGTLDTPVEYLCSVAHERARNLGLLKEGEMAWEVIDGKERIDLIFIESYLLGG